MIRRSGNHALKLADMDNGQAARYACIELGGIAAEIIMFNLHPAADLIADFVTSDFFSGESGLDWQDNEIHCGDFSEIRLIFDMRRIIL